MVWLVPVYLSNPELKLYTPSIHGNALPVPVVPKIKVPVPSIIKFVLFVALPGPILLELALTSTAPVIFNVALEDVFISTALEGVLVPALPDNTKLKYD